MAESTGKHGVGVVPIAGETLGAPTSYRHGSLVRPPAAHGDPDEARGDDRAVQALRVDAPIATIDFPEPAALGAEFVRWEIATAVAGALLGINPFDEPNVQQAKDATRVLLDRYKTDDQLADLPRTTRTSTGVTLTLEQRGAQALRRQRRRTPS